MRLLFFFRESFAIVRRLEVHAGSNRDDAVHVYRGMTLVVMIDDVLHVDGITNERIYVSNVVGQLRKISDAISVALKMTDVDVIEPNQRHEESQVRLSKHVGVCNVSMRR